MIGGPYRQNAKAAIQNRIARLEGLPRCAVPGCTRPTMVEAGVGLGAYHCRYHVQYKARHGSLWCPSIKAGDLRPYVKAASRWIRQNRNNREIAFALQWLRGLLDSAGPVRRTDEIRRKSATERAKVAFARLREAGIKPERLLAIHLGVTANIADDPDSHRVEEYRVVQVAKAVHRLASGTHQRWNWPMSDGTTRVIAMHDYPKSSGRVLRVIGRAIEEACREATAQGLQAVRDLKTSNYGPHPSRLPGWLPRHLRRLRGLEK